MNGSASMILTPWQESLRTQIVLPIASDGIVPGAVVVVEADIRVGNLYVSLESLVSTDKETKEIREEPTPTWSFKL